MPCLLVADGTARTASLTENVQREAMHPADQFEAFAALVAEGRSIEDIAADFSVTPLVVQRRLKLANVSPRLLADYRAEAVSLDQLMALAITDDHAAQEAAFYDAPTWQRGPHNLRDRLTEREIDAYRHPLVRFVGLDGYEQEGGGIRRDLFAEGDKARVSDRCRTAGTAGAGQAGRYRRQGAGRRRACADLRRAQGTPRPNKQQRRKLQTKLHELAEAVDAALDDEDEEKADALQEEGERLGEQLQALEDGLPCGRPQPVPLSPSTATGRPRFIAGCCEAGHCARWSGCGRVSAAKAKPRTRTQARTTKPRPPPCLTDWRSG